MTTIALEAVEKWFGDVQIIKGIDLDIADGEFVVFVGPSGCGKSTLLRMISGLEEASRGKLHIGGRDVTALPPSERGLAMVFQSYALYPHMSVRDNMGFALKTAGAPRSEIDSKVGAAAKVLKLDALLDRLPKELSGGQRQRVAIGRATVREPSAFLFDEPLSNLDAALRVEMRLEIAKLHQGLEATMIYVTHDQVEAMTLADKIVVLEAGEIRQIGSPRTLYDHPDNLFVAQFIGSPRMNVMPCEVSDGRWRLPDHGGGDWSDPRAPASLGVRPESISIVAPGDGTCAGKVEVVEYLGADLMVYVECEGLGLLTVRAAGDGTVAAGDDVGLVFAPDRLHFFESNGAAIHLHA